MERIECRECTGVFSSRPAFDWHNCGVYKRTATLEAENSRLKEHNEAISRLSNDLMVDCQRLYEANGRLTQERDEVRRVVEAARYIRHWHDTGRNNEGMIVSSEKVRELWKALNDYAARTQSTPVRRACVECDFDATEKYEGVPLCSGCAKERRQYDAQSTPVAEPQEER